MDQRSEAIKFLEENIEGKLVDIFFGSGFYGFTTRSKSTKSKNK